MNFLQKKIDRILISECSCVCIYVHYIWMNYSFKWNNIKKSKVETMDLKLVDLTVYFDRHCHFRLVREEIS